MTVPARVSVASLAVADVARSSAVHRALGWLQSSVSRDEIAFFKTVGALLAIYNAEALAAAGFTFPGRSPEGSRQVLLAFHARREEVDGVLQAAQAAGASMLPKAPAGSTGLLRRSGTGTCSRSCGPALHIGAIRVLRPAVARSPARPSPWDCGNRVPTAAVYALGADLDADDPEGLAREESGQVLMPTPVIGSILLARADPGRLLPGMSAFG